MVHLLMRDTAVVLQDVVVFYTLSESNLLGDREQFGELVVGDVVQLRAVKLGDDELCQCC
jgi:hypothetical protein